MIITLNTNDGRSEVRECRDGDVCDAARDMVQDALGACRMILGVPGVRAYLAWQVYDRATDKHLGHVVAEEGTRETAAAVIMRATSPGQYGFLSASDVATLRRESPNQPVLLRFGGTAREVVPAKDVAERIRAVEAAGDYLRDACIPVDARGVFIVARR